MHVGLAMCNTSQIICTYVHGIYLKGGCSIIWWRKEQSLRWRYHERDSVSNHQPHDCLLNGLFRRKSKKTSKLRVTGLCVGNSPGPVNSPHKGPVTRKMFPFEDVIMYCPFYPQYSGCRLLGYVFLTGFQRVKLLWYMISLMDLDQRS